MRERLVERIINILNDLSQDDLFFILEFIQDLFA